MFIDLRHLRAIDAINSLGSLGRAAAQLSVTQSALSHLIKGLEHYFDAPLFFRGSRPMRLAPAGIRLLALARQVLPAVEEAERSLKQQGKGDEGRLFITLECHSCFDWLIPSMDSYREQWPAVDMDLSLAYSFEPLTALRRGQVDLVITSDPVAGEADYWPLFEYQSVLAVAPNHPLAQHDFVLPSDLKDQTLITYPVCQTRLDVFAHFLKPTGVEPQEHRRAELTAIILQLVASHKGVAALPEWAAAEATGAGKVITIPLGDGGLWRTLYAATRRGEPQWQYLVAFIDTMRRLAVERLTNVRSIDKPARTSSHC